MAAATAKQPQQGQQQRAIVVWWWLALDETRTAAQSTAGTLPLGDDALESPRYKYSYTPAVQLLTRSLLSLIRRRYVSGKSYEGGRSQG